MVTKYGLTTVGIVVAIVFVLVTIGLLIQNGFLKYLLIFLGIAILTFTLYFFRDPDRNIIVAENVILSPADGKVIISKKIVSTKYVEGEAWQLSIFMSPLDVHVNRIPIKGVVEHLQHFDGEHIAAFEDKADQRNEKTEIGLRTKFGRILFTQIAGTIARRIICELEIGQTVEMGDRFGMIKFGSRVDLIVPLSWDVKAYENAKVVAGKTVLFEHKNWK